MFKLFRSPLEKDADFGRLEKVVREGVSPLSVFGVSDGQKVHIATALKGDRPLLYITQGAVSAEKIKKDIEFYTGKTAVVFPEPEQFIGASFQSNDSGRKRIEALSAILDGADCVIASATAVTYGTIPCEKLRSLRKKINRGDNIPTEEITRILTDCGYIPSPQTEGKGEFSVHGGIIDIFPPHMENSVRIDMFDTEVESIRLVDPVSQRTVERVNWIEILPLHESCCNGEDRINASKLIKEETEKFARNCKNRESVISATDTFVPVAERFACGTYPKNPSQFLPYVYPKFTDVLDYMPSDTLIVCDEPRMLSERSENAEKEFSLTVSSLTEEGRALPRHANVFGGFMRFWKRAVSMQTVAVQTISGALPEGEAKAVFTFEGRAMQSFHGKPEFLLQEVKMYRNAGYRIILCAGTQGRQDRLEKEFTENGIGTFPLKRYDASISEGQIGIVLGSAVRGFEYPKSKFVLISENDIFAFAKESHKTQAKRSKNSMDAFVELKTGDCVVHENSGIGIYGGIVKIETDGVLRDYMLLQYRDGDKLYVPVEQMNRVQKYIAPDDNPPKLNKLGTQDWSKTKAKVKKSIVDMTDKLVKLYRERENTVGIVFDKDTPWQRDFEEDFPYEETPDQLRCIAEIKADMESERAMDRLLCGDVGYGKTEVALRAAFKAVMSGKQAAILAPTTILVQQHYNTLKTRLMNFSAVRCDFVSRLKPAKEQKKILESLKNGETDIIVGTHRLLAKDVQFKNLGLLIVDEEQRFGVAHKEKIKQLKTNIDVLTLSATPIPRTLNMALSGIRDMSLLETPPAERFPVQTYVTEYSDTLVRDAIVREMERGGQVYYLYNRVNDIESVAMRIRKLVPEVRIGIGHGQMEEKVLDGVISGFYNGEYDVLLCTTIIENGVDIPGANTIIVEDAQRFGLSQLYQLRGRVGRSNRIAYAYFTVPARRSIGEDASKRLAAIEEFTQMGSGFKIAMRDLEIRGAGNLLGGEQHGHMSKIGYDLYCRMIKDTVDESLGRKKAEEKKATAEIKLDAYISEKYVPDEAVKFALYRKISDICTKEDAEDVRDEMRDRFGAIPEETENLIRIAYLRSVATFANVSVIREEKGNTVLLIPSPDLSQISYAAEKCREKCSIAAGNTFAVVLKTKGMRGREKLDLIEKFLENAVKS